MEFKKYISKNNLYHKKYNINYFDFDINILSKVNLLKFDSQKSFIKYIHSDAINNGLIYHTKQIYNFFINDKIQLILDNNNKIIVQINNTNFFQINNFIKYFIYSKTLQQRLNEFNITNFYINYQKNNFKTLILLYWNDDTIGYDILQKINNFNFNYEIIILKNYKNININFNCEILNLKEYGNPIIPTIIGWNYVSENIKNIKNIIVLHTLSNNNNRNQLINYFYNKSILDLEFELENSKFNFICNKRFNKNYPKDFIFMSNINCIKIILEKIKKNYQKYFNFTFDYISSSDILKDQCPILELQQLIWEK
jgi:hypothetical protein